MRFKINNILWNIVFVNPNDKNLYRSDGSKTVGVTDLTDKCIYLSVLVDNEFLRRVLAHELCHAFCMSYNVAMKIEQEEFLADWISLYGTELVYLLDDLMPILLNKSA